MTNMKKKIFSAISLILAIIMVLPVGIFAAEPAITADKNHDGGSSIVVYDGGTKTSVKLSVTGHTVLAWYTNTAGKSLIDVAADGTVTAKALPDSTTRTATVFASVEGESQPLSVDVSVKKYKVESVEIQSDTKTNYVVGQVISKSDIHVDAKYTDGTKAEDITDFEFTPTGALATTNNKIEVTYTPDNTLKDDIGIAVANVGIEDFVSAITLVKPTSGSEYGVGDILKPSDIEIKIGYTGSSTYTYATAAENSDIKVTLTVGGAAKAWNKDSGYTFSTADSGKSCTVKVEYAGKSKTVSFTVKSSSTSTDTPNTDGYTATLTNPSKKAYTVGEKFELKGASLTVKYNGEAITVAGAIDYTFTASDVGKTEFEFTLSFTHNGAKTCKVKVTGLSVTSLVDETPIRITSVYLNNDKYPVGYTFDLDDIDYIRAIFSNAPTTRNLDHAQLKKYTAYGEGDIDIEVLDSDGDRKSTWRCHNLQSTDVVDGTATLLFIFGDREYEFEITVGDPDISFIYDGSIVAEYDDIETALEYTIVQDPLVEDDFDISTLLSSDYITIKLGADFKFSSGFEFNPTNNVRIDLNGNKLTIDSDQIEVLRTSRTKTVTITNSSDTDGELVYSDLGVTLVLENGETAVFEYDEDAPGIVYVEVDVGSNGKVKADYDIDDDEIKVGYGSDIKFTITPNSGYVLDTLKVGTKAVSDKDYTVAASTGVVTYTLEDVESDITVSVTFKKAPVVDDWTNTFTSYTSNPFTDVSKSASYYTAVRFVYTNGLFEGTAKTKFEPNTTMTRAMFVTVIGRLAEKSGINVTTTTKSSYKDVVYNSETSWWAPYVEWATKNGIVMGHGDGTFGPEEEITHEQMYVIMYRYAMFIAQKTDTNVSSISLSSVGDNASISDWAVDAVKYAKKHGYIINTSGTKISPQTGAKRQELARLLEGFCDKVLSWEK